MKDWTFKQWVERYPIGGFITGSEGHDYTIKSNRQIVMSSNPYEIENAFVTLHNTVINATVKFQYIRNHLIIKVEDGYESKTTAIMDGFTVIAMKPGSVFTFKDSGQKSTNTYIDSNNSIIHRYLTTINLVNFTFMPGATDPPITDPPDGPKKGCVTTVGVMVIAFLMGLIKWVL